MVPRPSSRPDLDGTGRAKRQGMGPERLQLEAMGSERLELNAGDGGLTWNGATQESRAQDPTGQPKVEN